jgi:hypothetical protein
VSHERLFCKLFAFPKFITNKGNQIGAGAIRHSLLLYARHGS